MDFKILSESCIKSKKTKNKKTKTKLQTNKQTKTKNKNKGVGAGLKNKIIKIVNSYIQTQDDLDLIPPWLINHQRGAVKYRWYSAYIHN